MLSPLDKLPRRLTTRLPIAVTLPEIPREEYPCVIVSRHSRDNNRANKTFSRE